MAGSSGNALGVSFISEGMQLALDLNCQHIKFRSLLRGKDSRNIVLQEMHQVMDSKNPQTIHTLELFLKYYLANEKDRKDFIAAVEPDHELFKKLSGLRIV